MFVLEVLVPKCLAINGLASCTITFCKVASLAHEAWDDPVERRGLEVQRLAALALAFLASAQATEVLGRLIGAARRKCCCRAHAHVRLCATLSVACLRLPPVVLMARRPSVAAVARWAQTAGAKGGTFGQVFAKSSISIRPTDSPPISISKKTCGGQI